MRTKTLQKGLFPDSINGLCRPHLQKYLTAKFAGFSFQARGGHIDAITGATRPAGKSESSVSFSGPGYSADGFIERSTGTYELTVVSAGLFGVLNDIHKGSDTTALWTWIIDISAIVMVVVSFTGFIMIFFISKRKFPGLVVALTGAVIFAVLCCFCT